MHIQLQASERHYNHKAKEETSLSSTELSTEKGVWWPSHRCILQHKSLKEFRAEFIPLSTLPKEATVRLHTHLDANLPLSPPLVSDCDEGSRLHWHRIGKFHSTDQIGPEELPPRTNACACVCVCMYVCVRECMYVCMCEGVYVCMYVVCVCKRMIGLHAQGKGRGKACLHCILSLVVLCINRQSTLDQTGP